MTPIETSRARWRGAAIGALISAVAQASWVTWGSAAPEPVACPPPPECPTCEAADAPEAMPEVPSSLDGYVAESEFGTLRFVPWPDASAYPAERFRDDCTAVCAVPAPLHDAAGRVLVVDPAHLVCICFHQESSFPVTRWINWERVP